MHGCLSECVAGVGACSLECVGVEAETHMMYGNEKTPVTQKSLEASGLASLNLRHSLLEEIHNSHQRAGWALLII